MKRFMSTVLFIGVCAYVAILGYLYLNQRKLIYHPETDILEPSAYGLTGFSDHAITVGDQKVQAWYHAARDGFPTIVYYHGNATHLGNRAGIYKALADKGFGVLAPGYRGYGKSTGTPTEMGIYEDARLALDYLHTTLGVPLDRTMLYGESLGTGVAVQMATEHDVRAVVLVAAYLSVSRRAEEMYPFVPVRLLLKDRFDSYSKITRINAPLLQFHGEQDDVIPVSHGRKLFETAHAPKHSVFFPDNGHNDFDTTLISDHVLDFAKEHELIHD